MAQLFSLGHMTRAQKIWDFVFGVALIAGAPVGTFYIVALALTFAATSQFAGPVVLMTATAAFVGACLWRKKHRVLPSSLFVTEVAVAIVASVLFMLVFVAAGYAAYRAD